MRGSSDLDTIKIGAGMVYIGCESVVGAAADPCVINPNLPVAATGDYRKPIPGYWPNYSEISNEQRRAYLEWLAQGRRDPEADISYVFLFFYGIERRLIVDAQFDESIVEELPLLVDELCALLSVYGQASRSFKRYTSDLLDCVYATTLPEKAYEDQASAHAHVNDRRRSISAAIGQVVRDRQPIPSWLAFLWAQKSPDIDLKTAALRCKPQFEALFHHRYAESFGAGLMVKAGRTRLDIAYQPASMAIRGLRNVRLKGAPGRPYQLPKVDLSGALIDPIRSLCTQITKDLEPYSRFIAKVDDPSLLDAAALYLPQALWPDATRDAFTRLAGHVRTEPAILTLSDLYRRMDLPVEHAKVLNGALTSALSSYGIEVLPQARSSAPDVALVLYAAGTEDSAEEESKFEASLVILNLAASVCFADQKFCDAEFDHLQQWFNRQAELTQGQLTRIRAHLLLAKTRGSSPSQLSKRLDLIPTESRSALGAMMVSLAAADGTISPGEITILDRVYKLLGISGLHQDIHQHLDQRSRRNEPTTTPDLSAEQSVVVSSVASPAVELSLRSIPAPDAGAEVETRKTTAPPSFALNHERIAALQRDTDKLSKILSSIFVDEEADSHGPEIQAEADALANPTAVPERTTRPVEPSPYPLVPALGTKHALFLQQALTRQVWGRVELEALAKNMGLMLDGAIEIINEALDDEFGIIAFEGDHIIDINPAVHENLIR